VGALARNLDGLGVTSTAVCRTALLRHRTQHFYGSQHGAGYGTFLETLAHIMFSQPNPVIVQIRRELRGKLPDEWLEEVVSILEYQLSYQTLDELPTNDLLKLSLGASLSATLQTVLRQANTPTTETLPAPPFPLRLPWQ